VRIGHDITVTCLQIRGQVMKIGIDAPPSVRILRGELCGGDCAAGGLAEPIICDMSLPVG
jgi:hypothetical protein